MVSWNSLTADSVLLPNLPSAPPERYPSSISLCCRSRTLLPLLPLENTSSRGPGVGVGTGVGVGLRVGAGVYEVLPVPGTFCHSSGFAVGVGAAVGCTGTGVAVGAIGARVGKGMDASTSNPESGSST